MVMFNITVAFFAGNELAVLSLAFYQIETRLDVKRSLPPGVVANIGLNLAISPGQFLPFRPFAPIHKRH